MWIHSDVAWDCHNPKAQLGWMSTMAYPHDWHAGWLLAQLRLSIRISTHDLPSMAITG